jgi:hypothetical protein
MSEEILIHVPECIAPDKIGLIVDKAIIEFDLNVTLRGALKSYPRSTHWHIKRDRARGTFEITWWPQRRKLWIKIQAGRTAPWIDEIAPQFKLKIESHLRRLARSA